MMHSVEANTSGVGTYLKVGGQSRGAGEREDRAQQARGSRRQGECGVGRGCAPPHWGGVWEGGCAPSRQNFFDFVL